MRRLVLPLLSIAAFLAALHPYVARAEDGAPAAAAGTDRLTLLEAHVNSLRADVAYLLSREETMTAAASTQAAGLSTAATAITNGTLNARANGFESAAIAAPSRIFLLKGLQDAGAAMAVKPPALTAAEVRLKKEAEALRKDLGR
jgi:hypothetical protein